PVHVIEAIAKGFKRIIHWLRRKKTGGKKCRCLQRALGSRQIRGAERTHIKEKVEAKRTYNSARSNSRINIPRLHERLHYRNEIAKVKPGTIAEVLVAPL